LKVFVFGIRGFPFIGGGAEKHCEELYPRLVEKGYDITILCRKYFFPVWKGIKFKKLPYIDNPLLETMSHSIISTFYCLWKKPDIVHIHNMGACLLVPLLSLRGINVIFTIHSLNYQHPKWNKFARFVLNTCENIGISFSTHTIVISQEMIKHLRAKFYRSIKLHFIPNGVNEPDYTEAGFTLKKYGLTSKKYILAVGRLVPEKRFEWLINAYRKAKTDCKLVIVGNGERESKYKEELTSSKSDNIIFTGFLCGKELAEIYTNAGIFVSTSSHEGLPLVVLEALSYGLPVLLSFIPAHKELYLNPERYFNFPEELSFKISHPQEMSKSEKEKYQELLRKEYNWEATIEKTINVYGN
jgi:glycosyltransferase involved in cell wall biosynthesis